jgi:phosphopantetheinyl transferase
MSRVVLYIYRNRQGNTDDILCRCAEDFMGCASGTIGTGQIKRTAFGKPELPDLPIEVSVSHTGSLLAVLAVSRETGPVGLDIQLARNVSYLALAKRFFTEEEYRYTEQHGQTGFYRLWTRKEALTKYLGVPLARTLGAVSLAGESELADICRGVRFIELAIDENVFGVAAVRADSKVDLCRKELSEKQS